MGNDLRTLEDYQEVIDEITDALVDIVSSNGINRSREELETDAKVLVKRWEDADLDSLED